MTWYTAPGYSMRKGLAIRRVGWTILWSVQSLNCHNSRTDPFTSFFHSSTHQLRQLQQILDARNGSTAGLLYKWICRTQVGPTRREKGLLPRFGKIINPPLPPLPSMLQNLKAPAAPRVKRMGYGEISRGLPLTGCSPRATPN